MVVFLMLAVYRDYLMLLVVLMLVQAAAMFMLWHIFIKARHNPLFSDMGSVKKCL